MVIMDKFSLISSDVLFQNNALLLEISMCSTAIEFVGLAVVLVTDLL